MNKLNRYDIPKEVVQNVKNYFAKELNNYEVIEVLRASEHPDDDYLYHVAAKRNDEEYACWTCWNDRTQSLNYGHYNLVSKQVAMDILDEYYHTLN